MGSITKNVLHIFGTPTEVAVFITENLDRDRFRPIELSFAKSVTMPSDYNPEDWLRWNLANWGTATEGTDFTDWLVEPAHIEGNVFATITFNTKGGAPLSYLYNVSEKYPNLTYTLFYGDKSPHGNYDTIGIRDGRNVCDEGTIADERDFDDDYYSEGIDRYDKPTYLIADSEGYERITWHEYCDCYDCEEEAYTTHLSELEAARRRNPMITELPQPYTGIFIPNKKNSEPPF